MPGLLPPRHIPTLPTAGIRPGSAERLKPTLLSATQPSRREWLFLCPVTAIAGAREQLRGRGWAAAVRFDAWQRLTPHRCSRSPSGQPHSERRRRALDRPVRRDEQSEPPAIPSWWRSPSPSPQKRSGRQANPRPDDPVRRSAVESGSCSVASRHPCRCRGRDQ